MNRAVVLSLINTRTLQIYQIYHSNARNINGEKVIFESLSIPIYYQLSRGSSKYALNNNDEILFSTVNIFYIFLLVLVFVDSYL